MMEHRGSEDTSLHCKDFAKSGGNYFSKKVSKGDIYGMINVWNKAVVPRKLFFRFNNRTWNTALHWLILIINLTQSFMKRVSKKDYQDQVGLLECFEGHYLENINGPGNPVC